MTDRASASTNDATPSLQDPHDGRLLRVCSLAGAIGFSLIAFFGVVFTQSVGGDPIVWSLWILVMCAALLTYIVGVMMGQRSKGE